MSTPNDADNPGVHYVYRCYGEGDVLLYIGCTWSVPDRMFHLLHRCNVGKLPNGLLRKYMVRHDAVGYPTRVAARQAERSAIAIEAPLLNKQHNAKRVRKVAGGTYALVEPVHPVTAEAFPDASRIANEVAA